MANEEPQVSLEEVRTRFLEAETRLSDAATAVGAIQAAAERLGDAKEGLGAASSQLGRLAGDLGEISAALRENATRLREGVDAIRAGDPAEIRRQIQELDSAFTAMQAVVGQRLDGLDRSTDRIGQALTAHASRARRDGRILAALVAGLILISMIVGRLP